MACQFKVTEGDCYGGSLPGWILEKIRSPLSRLSSVEYQGIRKIEVLMIHSTVLRI